MAQTNINIRIDENLKKQFDKLCEELGLTMTTAINIFARAMVRFKGIPFEVSMNSLNQETLQAIEDVENGIGLSKPYTDIDEMFSDLMNYEEADI